MYNSAAKHKAVLRKRWVKSIASVEFFGPVYLEVRVFEFPTQEDN